MKKIVILLFISCTIFQLHAQDTIVSFFDSHWKACKPVFAVYYRKAYPENGQWIVKDYHMNGQLQMFGTYSDKALNYQQGSAIFYHDNGKIASIGQYVNNERVGLWKFFWRNGNLKNEIKFVKNVEDSISTFYDIDGKLFGRINYIKGKGEGLSKWYYPNNQICEIATFKNGFIIEAEDYDEAGNVYKTGNTDNTQEMSDDIKVASQLIKANLHYPPQLKQKGIQGIVCVHFIINKNGDLEQFEITKADNPEFNEEALRVVKLINRFHPVHRKGRIIEVDETIPIVFRLD